MSMAAMSSAFCPASTMLLSDIENAAHTSAAGIIFIFALKATLHRKRRACMRVTLLSRRGVVFVVAVADNLCGAVQARAGKRRRSRRLGTVSGSRKDVRNGGGRRGGLEIGACGPAGAGH